MNERMPTREELRLLIEDVTHLRRRALGHIESVQMLRQLLACLDLLAEIVPVMRDCRDELAQEGESAAMAWEHGDRAAVGRCQRRINEIHENLDALLARLKEMGIET